MATDNIKIVPFKKEHLRLMGVVSEGGFEYDGHTVDIIGKRYEEAGFGYTAFDKGKPLCAGGILTIWAGVGDVWSYITDEAKQKGLWLYRTFKCILNKEIQDNGFHRLQTLVLEKDDVAVRWIEKLGFECEGLLKRFGKSGENYYIYAKFGEKNVA